MREDLLLEELDDVDTEWQESAACATADPEWFTAPGHEEQAFWLCGRCKVRGECGEYAELEDERFGIWGGRLLGWP